MIFTLCGKIINTTISFQILIAERRENVRDFRSPVNNVIVISSVKTEIDFNIIVKTPSTHHVRPSFEMTSPGDIVLPES